ncbi:MAG: branched-chain amino acid ABC transporter permease [Firmicutes bacterium HGW-Firmicutes-14]|nr:MAG: branched-chain amino acid ABC transporter permease [Firmicutes bacterium HGW-Firmicutes-14]
MSLASELLQYLLSGLTMGGIYALVALGFVIIHNVTGIINFAQGEFVMLGAMFMVTLVKAGLPAPVALLLSILLVMIIVAVIEVGAIRSAKRASPVSLVILTIGLSTAIKGIALLVWGTHPYRLEPFTKGGPINIGGATIVPQSLWIIGTTVVVLAVTFFVFEYTYWGKALRACVVNKFAARLMGINPRKMSLIAFVFSAALSALAGIVIAPITYVTYDMGLMLGLKGFVAAVLGGLSSTPGAVFGGLALGVIESMGAGLISSGYKDGISFVLLLLVLFLKPGGIFGISGSKRV